MFPRSINYVTIVTKSGSKCLSTTAQKSFKVVVSGACGGIGQPLCLLLKQNPLITHLAMHDILKSTPGVALDVSHVDTACKVTSHVGCEICVAMKNADVVVVPAGMPRKPGMTRDDLFASNASILRDLAVAFAQYAPPKAILAIITNPVNSMVPIATEVMKKAGRHNPKKILGVTTLDTVRASTFVAEVNGCDPADVNIPIIGGHSGVTIIPVFSQATPKVKLTGKTEIQALISKIQEAGTAVLNGKAGTGTATLGMAYAGARFICSVLKGLAGEPNVVECAFVQSKVNSSVEYFANPIVLGKEGMEKNPGYGPLNELEQELLKRALPELDKNIKKGESFVRQETTKTCST